MFLIAGVCNMCYNIYSDIISVIILPVIISGVLITGELNNRCFQ